MKRIISLSLALLCTAGCLRGESKSLDEVFNEAKNRYAEASKAELPAEVNQTIDQIVKHLDTLTAGNGGAQSGAAISQITDGITTLLPRAGYTVRPALTELRNQYAELSNGNAPSAQELKLLAARTFSTLGEELHAARFGIEQ